MCRATGRRSTVRVSRLDRVEVQDRPRSGKHWRTAGMQGMLDWQLLRRKPGSQPQHSPPLIPCLLPEPERAGRTTPHSYSDPKVLTSDSARQPELTSSLSTEPVGSLPRAGSRALSGFTKDRKRRGGARARLEGGGPEVALGLG